MKRVLIAAITTTLCVTASAALAQEEGQGAEWADEMESPPGSAVLDSMMGTWNGTGNMMGMQCSESVTWSWVHGGWVAKATSSTTLTMPDGTTMAVTSDQFMHPGADGTVMGMYMDNMGTFGEFTGRVEGESLVLEWTDDHGTHKVTMSSNADGSVGAGFQSQGADGSWTDAGSMTYTRAE